MVTSLVTVIVITFTVSKWTKLNTVSTVIEYEISNILPVKEIRRNITSAEMKPFDYASLPKEANTLSIEYNQFLGCDDFLKSHE